GILDQKFNASVTTFAGANALALLNDGRVYLAGSFTDYASFPRRYVARMIGRDLNLGTNTFSVSATNFAFGPAGGNETIAVTTSGCGSWKTYIGTNNWITLTTGANGVGSDSVVLAVAPNTNTAPRSTVLIIAGNIVTIAQNASFAP